VVLEGVLKNVLFSASRIAIDQEQSEEHDINTSSQGSQSSQATQAPRRRYVSKHEQWQPKELSGIADLYEELRNEDEQGAPHAAPSRS